MVSTNDQFSKSRAHEFLLLLCSFFFSEGAYMHHGRSNVTKRLNRIEGISPRRMGWMKSMRKNLHKRTLRSMIIRGFANVIVRFNSFSVHTLRIATPSSVTHFIKTFTDYLESNVVQSQHRDNDKVRAVIRIVFTFTFSRGRETETLKLHPQMSE